MSLYLAVITTLHIVTMTSGVAFTAIYTATRHQARRMTDLLLAAPALFALQSLRSLILIVTADDEITFTWSRADIWGTVGDVTALVVQIAVATGSVLFLVAMLKLTRKTHPLRRVTD
ncbi:hypothetical protein [Euzebya tangerina]|uniref:hypothetical protein n=1 Tax=Euzebya tangerina TaxID=591198 RepID=UPI000E3144B2|nr:hypothetical protein [Euzebya tangerina]